jgi:ribonuclease H-related protein
LAKSKNQYYAYSVEGKTGIVRSWNDCEARVHGKAARYRGFATFAQAKAWLDAGAPYEDKAAAKRQEQEALPEKGGFVDAGTGAGLGVEVNVTDREGTPLLHLCLKERNLTPRGTCLLKGGRTNNYGELIALLLGIRIARRLGARAVFSDSALVLDFWSRGHVTAKKRQEDAELFALAKKTSQERLDYERAGGRCLKISGGINPADLGYHRE